MEHQLYLLVSPLLLDHFIANKFRLFQPCISYIFHSVTSYEGHRSGARASSQLQHLAAQFQIAEIDEGIATPLPFVHHLDRQSACVGSRAQQVGLGRGEGGSKAVLTFTQIAAILCNLTSVQVIDLHLQLRAVGQG